MVAAHSHRRWRIYAPAQVGHRLGLESGAHDDNSPGQTISGTRLTTTVAGPSRQRLEAEALTCPPLPTRPAALPSAPGSEVAPNPSVKRTANGLGRLHHLWSLWFRRPKPLAAAYLER